MGMLAVAAAQGPPQKVSAEEASSSEETSSSSKESEAKPAEGEAVRNAPFIFIPKADDPAQATHMVTAMLGEQLNQIAALGDKVGWERERENKERERERERVTVEKKTGRKKKLNLGKKKKNPSQKTPRRSTRTSTSR